MVPQPNRLAWQLAVTAAGVPERGQRTDHYYIMLLDLPTNVWVESVQGSLSACDLAALRGSSPKAEPLVEVATARRLADHGIEGGRVVLGLSPAAACFLVERHNHAQRVCIKVSAAMGTSAVVSSQGTAFVCGWCDLYGQLGLNLPHVTLVAGRYGSRRLHSDCPSQFTFAAVSTSHVRQLPRRLIAQDCHERVDDAPIENVVSASVGSFHTGIVLADGTLLTAGNNSSGELGCYEEDGTPEVDSDPADIGVHNRAVFCPVSIGAPVAAVSAGLGHTLVLLRDGGVMSFGANYSCQLGRPELPKTTSWSGFPLGAVSLPTRAVQVIANSGSSRALLSNGKALAWGNNSDAGLGIGVEDYNQAADDPSDAFSTAFRDTPTPVIIDEPITKLASKAAVTVSGKLFVWGSNDCGQLGLPVGEQVEGAFRPDRILTPTVVPAPFIVDVDTSSKFIVALASNGELLTAGDDRSSQLSRALGPMAHEFDEQENFPNCPQKGWCDPQLGAVQRAAGSSSARAVAVAAGDYHAVVMLDDGSVLTWGGQTADGFEEHPSTGTDCSVLGRGVDAPGQAASVQLGAV